MEFHHFLCEHFKSNLFHIYEAGNIQEDIISIELNELLSKIQQPEPLTPLVTEIPIPSAAPLSKVTFNKEGFIKNEKQYRHFIG